VQSSLKNISTCFVSALSAVAYQQFVLQQFLHTDGLMEALQPTEYKHEQLYNTTAKGTDIYYTVALLTWARLYTSSELVSQLADDWHELLVPQCNVWPSILHSNSQLDPWCS